MNGYKAIALPINQIESKTVLRPESEIGRLPVFRIEQNTLTNYDFSRGWLAVRMTKAVNEKRLFASAPKREED